jgi:hypothetical protein
LGNFLSSQTGLAKKVGLLGNLIIEKYKGKITIKNIGGKLLYTFSKNNHNFKVLPFDKLNNNTLKNYKNIEKKY